ncbi:MAG: translation initiation factor IF-2 [Chitinophagaceae bacterium]|nr:translation initiation factor IF-2 [Chitinophagaceae bacterium]
MSEVTTPRLMAAAKEFNIGKDTLVGFLVARGFSKDDLNPTSKLTEDMYRSLQQEFQSDKVAKIKSDQIDLPRGAVAESKKKRDEEEISFTKKEVKKAVVKEEEKFDEEQKTPEPTPPQLTVVEEPAETTEITNLLVPEIEGPKVLDKIDLSTIDSSTRPKKGSKKKDEQQEESVPQQLESPISGSETELLPSTEIASAADSKKTEANEEATSGIDEVPEIATPQQEDTAALIPVVEMKQSDVHQPEVSEQQTDNQETEEISPTITNIRADKLEGPKIMGRIVLPVDSDTRPKQNDEKRKRKRIPIEKKGDNNFRGPGPGGSQGPQRSGGYPNQGQGYQGQNTGPRPTITPQQGGNNFRRGPGTGTGTQGGPGTGPGRGPGGPGSSRPPGTNRPTISKAGPRRENKEIDKKEIQDKIRETQAKLSGSGGRGKSMKAKYRRAKREEMAEQMGADQGEDNKLQVTEFISVSELASLMDVSYAEIIGKCMGLGMMVSINQRLDAEVIELVAGEFGFDVEFMGVDDVDDLEEEEEDDSPDDLKPRAPIVTIMGHVDHGKTSLLDYIRSASVVAGEAGGITQHIGAYEVTLPNGKHITFLDTPGHEAFTAMRARGAKVTDIAVIVIAADDAVMPQTREAISHAQAAGVPMIFAINKVDKEGSNPEKIREQLAGMNLLVEEWGGKFQSQELSAKKGMNVDLLLEKILLEAELLDVKANPNKEGTGTVIEASLDKGRGYVATVLVQNGTLRVGDLVVSGQYFGKVKAMFNERNKRVDEAPPSTPVLILGLNGAPQAGEKFKMFEDESEAKETANRRAQILREQGIRTKKHITLDEIGRRLALGNFKELNLIIKADFDGSVEALSDSLQKLSTDEIAIRVVHKAVGGITESDVLLATASDAIILGFQVRPSLQANKLAEKENIEIKTYTIIYNAIEEIKSAMEGMLEPKIQEKVVANVEVREVYKFDKATVAGCQVVDGKISRNSKIRIVRDGIIVYPTGEGANGELGSLKRYKDDAKEVTNGMECGLTIKNFNDLRVGDIVEAYEEEEVKRTL